jgi:hypothetical protein
MSAKKMKFPIQDFPIRGGVLTPAKRAAAMRYAFTQLEAQGNGISTSQVKHRAIKVRITPATKKR